MASRTTAARSRPTGRRSRGLRPRQPRRIRVGRGGLGVQVPLRACPCSPWPGCASPRRQSSAAPLGLRAVGGLRGRLLAFLTDSSRSAWAELIRCTSCASVSSRAVCTSVLAFATRCCRASRRVEKKFVCCVMRYHLHCVRPDLGHLYVACSTDDTSVLRDRQAPGPDGCSPQWGRMLAQVRRAGRRWRYRWPPWGCRWPRRDKPADAVVPFVW